MIDPCQSLEAIRDRVHARLLAAPGKRDCPFRTPALATAGTQGGAEARLVVLREVRSQPLLLEIHTDTASAKIRELERDPGGTLLFWDPAEQFQIRIRARLSMRPGSPEDWAKIPDIAQRAYGGDPAPGTVIGSPSDHTVRPTAERHMILSAEVSEFEILLIDTSPHVRALFRSEDGFTGQWLAP